MTEPDRYGEEIRRALRAAAELVVPAGDGLDIIRKRAARRPPVLAWLLATLSYLPRQLAAQVRVMASELPLIARGESDLLPRLRARLHAQAGRARSPQAWLRPALAAAGALLLVVAVTFALPELHQPVANQANNQPGSQGRGGASGHAFGSGHPSPGASGSGPSSASGSQYPGPLPIAIPGGMLGRISLIQMLPGLVGSTSPTACVSSSTPAGPIPATPDPSATPPGGSAQAGAPDCTPGASPTPTTPAPSTTPTSTPPTPPTPTPTSTPTPPTPTPTSTPPTPTPTPTPTPSMTPTAGSTAATPTAGSTISTPTDGSTAATPADTPAGP